VLFKKIFKGLSNTSNTSKSEENIQVLDEYPDHNYNDIPENH
jgi:hypothetical protein